MPLAAGMNHITSFRQLDTWNISMDLVDSVFTATRSLPRTEFDLKRQINRAVVSIPSNVAEGWKRKRRRAAYQNHVSIAMGSHAELETQLEICFRNSLLDRKQCERTIVLLNRAGSLLEKLFDSLD
jgi:four helix bundle protein